MLALRNIEHASRRKNIFRVPHSPSFRRGVAPFRPAGSVTFASLSGVEGAGESENDGDSFERLSPIVTEISRYSPRWPAVATIAGACDTGAEFS